MKLLSTEEIILQFIKTHDNKYDYSLVKYKNAKTKVKIICKEHGIFEQNPCNHKNGVNCPECGKIIGINKLTKSQKNCIKDFKKVHADKFDYSLVDYKNKKTKVKIICKKHGVFKQTPNNHLKGAGCLKCADSEQCKDIDILINQFIEFHGNKFDYSKVKENYINSHTKVKIICKKHGVFEQTPNNHLISGCYWCRAISRYKNIETFLYYIKIEGQYKIGITMSKGYNIDRAIKNRYHSEYLKGIKIDLIDYKLFQDGSEAYINEQNIIKNNLKYKIYKGDMILESGYTETFYKDILNLDKGKL